MESASGNFLFEKRLLDAANVSKALCICLHRVTWANMFCVSALLLFQFFPLLVTAVLQNYRHRHSNLVFRFNKGKYQYNSIFLKEGIKRKKKGGVGVPFLLQLILVLLSICGVLWEKDNS